MKINLPYVLSLLGLNIWRDQLIVSCRGPRGSWGYTFFIKIFCLASIINQSSGLILALLQVEWPPYLDTFQVAKSGHMNFLHNFWQFSDMSCWCYSIELNWWFTYGPYISKTLASLTWPQLTIGRLIASSSGEVKIWWQSAFSLNPRCDVNNAEQTSKHSWYSVLERIPSGHPLLCPSWNRENVAFDLKGSYQAMRSQYRGTECLNAGLWERQRRGIPAVWRSHATLDLTCRLFRTAVLYCTAWTCYTKYGGSCGHE
jgi:hypothetical protein